MSTEVAELNQKIKFLETRIDELARDHGMIANYVQALEPNVKQAILTLVEALARVAHGAPHLKPEEQAKIKKLLGIG